MSTSATPKANLAAAFIGELQQESATTRKILERIPAETFDYKPHEKSMSMVRLASHIAEMIAWVGATINADELDFATMDYKPFEPQSTAELVEYHDKNLAEAIEVLSATSDETMFENWTMRNGEQIYMTLPKIQVLRAFVYNHIFHHRGQLSVYLRLNDIPVPAMYGPSADEAM